VSRGLALVVEQPALAFQPPPIAGEAAVGADQAVAGDDDRDGIPAVGGTDGTGGTGRPQLSGDLAVGRGAREGHSGQRRPDLALIGRSLEPDGDVEPGASAREVLDQLATDLRERGRVPVGEAVDPWRANVAVKVQAHQVLSGDHHQHAPERGGHMVDAEHGTGGHRRSMIELAMVDVEFDGALDWDLMLGYLATRAIRGVEVVSAGAYRRTIVIRGAPADMEVALAGPGRLRATAHLPDASGLDTVVEATRRLFNLDFDVAAANAALRGDRLLAPLTVSRPGLRVPGICDPFEVGVRAIIGQQVSVKGAGTITGRLVDRHGTPIEWLGDPGLSHLFPSPQQLASADLRGIGLTTARMRAIRGFAQAVSDGSLRLDRGLGLEDLVLAITAVVGLGPWTAHYLAVRMGFPDAFPAGDLGLRRALERASGESLGPRTVGAMAERWRPWRAHAAIHLWLAH
jgi:3-methyladenine DNA glycosylase/8-oxoguanine DNA glycosylase